MSSASSTPPRAEGEQAVGTDPSMEDILASIRRILNEDDTNTPAAPSKDRDDVLVLDPSMMVAEPAPNLSAPLPALQPPDPPQPDAPRPPAPQAAAPQTTMPQPAAFEAAAPKPAAPQPAPQRPASSKFTVSQPPASQDAAPQAAVEPGAAVLVAPEAAATAASAVSTLVQALVAERTASVHRTGPTIEDVVREELRPMLKAWLDQHLPPLVERLVRAEIERVVGRATP